MWEKGGQNHNLLICNYPAHLCLPVHTLNVTFDDVKGIKEFKVELEMREAHKHIQAYTSIYKHIQAYTSIYKHIRKHNIIRTYVNYYMDVGVPVENIGGL